MAQPNPSVDELEAREEQLFRTGPLSVLTSSVKSNTQARAERRERSACFFFVRSAAAQPALSRPRPPILLLFVSAPLASPPPPPPLSQILVNLRNNHKLLGRVKAFDRHCNLLLEGVREFYSEAPRDAATGRKARGAPVMKDRYLPKLFVRGDSVILVVRNPK